VTRIRLSGGLLPRDLASACLLFAIGILLVNESVLAGAGLKRKPLVSIRRYELVLCMHVDSSIMCVYDLSMGLSLA
jgi:hypothetical protein